MLTDSTGCSTKFGVRILTDSTRHDYEANLAVEDAAARPGSSRCQKEARKLKRDELKTIVERKDEFPMIEYLKRVTFHQGYL
jgi:hypothetical protein